MPDDVRIMRCVFLCIGTTSAITDTDPLSCAQACCMIQSKLNTAVCSVPWNTPNKALHLLKSVLLHWKVTCFSKSKQFFSFTVVPCVLMLSSLLFYPTDTQSDCSKRMSKFTLKCCYMFRFNNHHQGATIRALLKL